MKESKLQGRHESSSDRELAELIVNGVHNEQEAQSLHGLLLRRRREHYKGLVENKNPVVPKSVGSNHRAQEKRDPPKKPRADKTSPREVFGGIWVGIAILISFWAVPEFGWLKGLLFAAGWPLILLAGILVMLFHD